MLTRTLPLLLALSAACASTPPPKGALPDLVVDSVEVLGVRQEAGASVVDVKVVVRNAGRAPLPVRSFRLAAEVQNAAFEPTGTAVEASYTIGGPEGARLFEAEGRLEPKERTTVRTQLWIRTPWPGQEHRLVVLADAAFGAWEGRITESDEENNTGSTTLRLP